MILRAWLLTTVVTGTLALAQTSSTQSPQQQQTPPPQTPSSQVPQASPSQTPAQPSTSQEPDPNDPSSPNYKGEKQQKPSWGQRVKDRMSLPCVHVGAGPCVTNPGPAPKPTPGDDQTSDAQDQKRPGAPAPNEQIPRSDRTRSLNEEGESSSRSTIGDLSPPKDDAAKHPDSSTGDDVSEVRKWDPHKSIKDVEVGDYYLMLAKQAGDGSDQQRDRLRAAESRYQEALEFKDNNAEAMFKLAVTEEKLNKADEARKYYALYLKTLPKGDHAEEAQKALSRLGGTPTAAKQ